MSAKIYENIDELEKREFLRKHVYFPEKLVTVDYDKLEELHNRLSRLSNIARSLAAEWESGFSTPFETHDKLMKELREALE